MQALLRSGLQAFEAAVEFVYACMAAHGLPELKGLHVGAGGWCASALLSQSKSLLHAKIVGCLAVVGVVYVEALGCARN